MHPATSFKKSSSLNLLIISLAFYGCSQEGDSLTETPPYSFEMLEAYEIDYTEAILQGELRFENDLDGCGFVWSTQPDPTLIGASKIYFQSYHPGTDTFKHNVLGLKVNTTYYARSFIIDGPATTYGNQISFKTLAPSSPDDFLDFPGQGRTGAVSFIIDGKGYMGLGSYYSEETGPEQLYLSDFWELDLAARVWTRKKDFPFGELHAAVAFTVGGKGYVGTGFTRVGANEIFYQYDAKNDEWTPSSTYPGGKLAYATTFSIGNEIYVGTGMTKESKMVNSFFLFEPGVGWVKKANYPGTSIGMAIGFSIGGKGYIGLGTSERIDDNPRELWEYDPNSDSWTRKADYPVATVRPNSVAFVINNNAYVGLGGFDGLDKTIWKYDPISNTWAENGAFKGTARSGAVVFNVNDKALIGTGSRVVFCFTDFVQYIPK